MKVIKAFEKFIHSRHLKGVSENTITSYRNLTARFIRFIGADTDMESISQEDLENFVDYLYSIALSRNSIASYIRNTKIFLKWYQRKNKVNYSAVELVIPKAPKKIVHIYSPTEIDMIFNTIDTCCDWLTIRNKAIIALMLDSGLRQAEICNLKIYNLFFDDCRLKVCGKGNKERIVPFGNMAQRLTKEYLTLRPYKSENLFVSYHGDALTCNAVKSMTWDLQQRLPFAFSSHKLRHNFATNYLINQYDVVGQMDMYQLMTIMGHEDVATLRRYLHHANGIIASRNCISHLDRIYKDRV